MMRVNIAESNDNVGERFSFKFTTSADEIDVIHEAFSFDGPIHIDGSLMNTGRSYRIEGMIHCRKAFDCDRCLEHFIQGQEHSFSEDYKQDEEDKEENEVVNYFDGDAIDIADLIRDTILAAQPLNNICSLDCHGLCPKCGANLNKGDCGCDCFVPDPRLAALQQLLKKK